MIYAARPGDPAYVSGNMTQKLIKQMVCCLNEKRWILFPDDIQYFDPDQICEVAPRITFKMAIGLDGFEYKDELTILRENKALRDKTGHPTQVRQKKNF